MIRRARISVASTLLAALTLLISSCSNASVSVGVGYGPPVIPVKFAVMFSIKPNGDISVTGDAGIVTDVGVFSAEVSFDQHANPPPDETLLIIRHHVPGGLVDSVFRIGTGEEIVVKFSGYTVESVSDRKVFIDLSKGRVTHLLVKNAGRPAVKPTPSPNASSRSGFQSIALKCDPTSVPGAVCSSVLNGANEPSVDIDITGISVGALVSLCDHGYKVIWTDNHHDIFANRNYGDYCNQQVSNEAGSPYGDIVVTSPNALANSPWGGYKVWKGRWKITFRLIAPSGRVVAKASYQTIVIG